MRERPKVSDTQFSTIADHLEAAADGMARLDNAPELTLTPSQLRRAAEQIREVFIPTAKANSNLRLYDTIDYWLYTLYAYLDSLTKLAPYRSQDRKAVRVSARMLNP